MEKLKQKNRMSPPNFSSHTLLSNEPTTSSFFSFFRFFPFLIGYSKGEGRRRKEEGGKNVEESGRVEEKKDSVVEKDKHIDIIFVTTDGSYEDPGQHRPSPPGPGAS
jgi:hypothetical protein